MIRAIKLKNCIPYQEAEISECKMINYIFGSNGSGKSTIGAFLSGDSSTRFDNSSIEWEGESHEKIEVYNKSFRQKTFNRKYRAYLHCLYLREGKGGAAKAARIT